MDPADMEDVEEVEEEETGEDVNSKGWSWYRNDVESTLSTYECEGDILNYHIVFRKDVSELSIPRLSFACRPLHDMSLIILFWGV